MDFYAAGDGATSDAEAFEETWKVACSSHNSEVIMYIPAGKTFLLNQTRFDGPCKSPITVQVDCKRIDVVAPNSLYSKPSDLLTFYGVDNLTVNGSSQTDGRGAQWWDCYNKKSLSLAHCNNLWVINIRLKDIGDKNLILYECMQVQVHNVSIAALGDSPNTDGINIGSSNHVNISSCSMHTGDDCVSILSGTTDVNVTNTTCGPGHGISVGSLGGVGDGPTLVERITVSNCSFFNTTTGVRIKLWQGGQGKATGFLFTKLRMTAIRLLIDIDQFYCPQGNGPPRDGGVAITDPLFVDIQGTSSERETIKIMCSKSVPCHDI
ncbi:polygalacturonase ADPG2-like [Triticum dicoccoides]|uniref:polygalacturonase ADPG2-like n=1 Tax=Triticum dicoccoides TaxID=85692 RepID=UPI00188F728B|nr:polygalacturonase ADPG2-like [Triticum dicoccoides]